MKTSLSIQLLVLGFIFSVTACKDAAKPGLLPPVTGNANEVLIVMNKALQDGAVGDSLKAFFKQEQPGLPQAESIMDVLSLPPQMFDKTVKSHRNVLMVKINPEIDSASLTLTESPWARSQKYFEIKAPNQEAFFQLFNKNKEQIMGIFLKAERNRLIDVYKSASNSNIFNLFKNKYDLLLYVPSGYNLNKDSANFVWISQETRKDSKGIIFFQEKYDDQAQFTYQLIQDRMNRELKKHVPGPLKDTYMALDMAIPATVVNYQFEGHYAILIRGLWMVENDFMAGPYMLNAVLDQENNRIIYMMGYVYAPEDQKRNKLREVEAIMFSMDIDYQKKAETVADTVAKTK